MALRLMGQMHPLPAGLGAVNQSLLPVDIHRLGGMPTPWPGAWTQLTIYFANLGRVARSPTGLWVLSMANCHDKAMHTLGTLSKTIGRSSPHLLPFTRSSFVLVSLGHRSLQGDEEGSVDDDEGEGGDRGVRRGARRGVRRGRGEWQEGKDKDKGNHARRHGQEGG